jgi:formate/nitrite transporter
MNKLIDVMKQKVSDSSLQSIKLGIQAGIYIGFGSLLYSITLTFNGNPNFIKLIGALLFTIGLNFVVFFKAQLFTGNNLMTFSLLKKKINLIELLRNWIFVYIGNFIGAIIFGIFVFYIFSFVPGLDIVLNNIANLKVSYSFNTAFTKAIYCNFLVCMGIYFAIIFEKKRNKIIGIVIPITAFVYFGFEHSIANMFFIPTGLFNAELLSPKIPTLFLGNIIPVTLGNIIGGLIFSTTLYIFYMLKKE